MRSIILTLILASFPLNPGVQAQSTDADNPYGVEMPTKSSDTAQPDPKVDAPPAETAPTQPQVDTTSKKVTKPKAVKNKVTLKKKKAAIPEDTAKVAVKPDSMTQKKDSAVAAKVAVKDTVVKDTVSKQDTVSKALVDSIKTPVAVEAKPPDSTTSKPVVSDTAIRKPRVRIVRETSINSINQMKGRYRSPKKALFMSLVVPGLGQAYVGQSAFTYSRAAFYFGTDIALFGLWHQYVVVKHDRQVRNYERFADQNWSQLKYEDAVKPFPPSAENEERQFIRNNYCDVVQEVATTPGATRNSGCKDPTIVDPSIGDYSGFLTNIDVKEGKGSNQAAIDSTHALRASFPNAFQFYQLIGQDLEFTPGWKDAIYPTLNPDSLITGTSAFRDEYIDMRAKSNQYSRMQAWFIGGVVLNHIASALDAALTASFHNRHLYESETRWYDRLNFDGGLAFEQGWPLTRLTASLSF